MIRIALVSAITCALSISCRQVDPITQVEQNEMVLTALEYAFDDEFMGDAQRTHPIGSRVLVHYQDFPNGEFPDSAASRSLELFTSTELAQKKGDTQSFNYLELHLDDERPSKPPIIYVVTRGFYFDESSRQLNQTHAESLGIKFTKSDGIWIGTPTFHMIE